MLSRKEKEELLEDGRNPERKKEFALVRKITEEEPRLLDSYIRFLMNIQKVFSSFPVSHKSTITMFNKL